MRAEISDLIRQLDQAGEIKPSDLPWLVTHIANELGNLIRLSGAAVASVLRTHGIAVPDGALGGTGADSGYRDRVALRLKEAAKMLSVSNSAMYEMIGKRQIGVSAWAITVRSEFQRLRSRDYYRRIWCRH
jgi:hypothetical protein